MANKEISIFNWLNLFGEQQKICKYLLGNKKDQKLKTPSKRNEFLIDNFSGVFFSGWPNNEVMHRRYPQPSPDAIVSHKMCIATTYFIIKN